MANKNNAPNLSKFNSPDKLWKYNLKLLKDRIYKFEKKTGMHVDLQDLADFYSFNLQYDEGYWMEDIDRMWQVRGEQFRRVAYYDYEDEYFDGYEDNHVSEPVNVEEPVIDNLIRFIQDYTGGVNTSIKSKQQRRLDYRKSYLLDYIYEGIDKIGKQNFAMKAENLQEAEAICSQYMDESDGTVAGFLLPKLGKLIFGRDYTLGDLLRMERYEESNGSYA